MTKRVFRSCKEPQREGLSWDERWKGADGGLITCWEVGREMRKKEPELAQLAENAELPPMGWKGGIDKKVKAKKKHGTLFYLAQWQGIRGEDLDIDTDVEHELFCSKTGVKVIFTGDVKKYGAG